MVAVRYEGGPAFSGLFAQTLECERDEVGWERPMEQRGNCKAEVVDDDGRGYL